jgi:exosortase A-associated hydrolase 1
VLMIVGGPQYRVGSHRQFVLLARSIAAAGFPVLRFDYRGMGDSDGEFQGFEHIAEDIEAAVKAFRREVPELKKVVLWGGCDAASAAMIHGWKIPDAVSLVVGNPWVYSHEVQATVRRQHYLSRLGDWSFWRKVLRFEYNFVEYALAALKKVSARMGRHIRRDEAGTSTEASTAGSFVDRMLDGLERFEGPVLFLMSGQSMLTREFDELVDSDARWRAVYNRPGYQRVDFPDADQTFSTREARGQVYQALHAWLRELG